jgi:CheY-like chemotaxis protein
MLDNEDLKWIATTSTDLNAMLQQIARYSDLARQHKGEHNYIGMLGERVELAAKTAQSIFDRVTSKILEGTTGKMPIAPARTPAFSIVRSATNSAPISIKNKDPNEPALAPASPTPKSSEPKKPSNGTRVSSKQGIKNPYGDRELILLVDDEAQVAELAAEMLADEGYKVIVAHDGFEALKIYQQMGKEIGLVILDFFLPVMDGDAVFDELRTLNPDIAVVLSSGFAEQSKLGNMLAQGLRGFIPKPYSREKLLEQVRSTIDAARQPTH